MIFLSSKHVIKYSNTQSQVQHKAQISIKNNASFELSKALIHQVLISFAKKGGKKGKKDLL